MLVAGGAHSKRQEESNSFTKNVISKIVVKSMPDPRHTSTKNPPISRRVLYFAISRGLCGQCVLCLTDDCAECFGLVHGQVGQNLTVYFDTG